MIETIQPISSSHKGYFQHYRSTSQNTKLSPQSYFRKNLIFESLLVVLWKKWGRIFVVYFTLKVLEHFLDVLSQIQLPVRKTTHLFKKMTTRITFAMIDPKFMPYKGTWKKKRNTNSRLAQQHGQQGWKKRNRWMVRDMPLKVGQWRGAICWLNRNNILKI